VPAGAGEAGTPDTDAGFKDEPGILVPAPQLRCDQVRSARSALIDRQLRLIQIWTISKSVDGPPYVE